MKNISADLLPRARKKLTIVKVTSATEEGLAKKSPAKRQPKRRAPRKFKPKPSVPLDLNAIPEEEEEELPVKLPQKRAPRKKSGVSQNGGQCSKQSNASNAMHPAVVVAVSGVHPETTMGNAIGCSIHTEDVVDGAAPGHVQGLTTSECHGNPPKSTRRRGPCKKTVETVLPTQCSSASVGDSDGTLPPTKVPRKRAPRKKKPEVLVDVPNTEPTVGSTAPASAELSPSRRPTLLEPQPKVVRQRAPWRKVGIQCHSNDGSDAADGTLNSETDSVEHSQVTVDETVVKTARKRAPRKKTLPDLNAAVPDPTSTKKTTRRKYVKKIIGKSSPPKSRVSVFQGLGPLLTSLCASAEGNPHTDSNFSGGPEVHEASARTGDVVDASHGSTGHVGDGEVVGRETSSVTGMTVPIPERVHASVTESVQGEARVSTCTFSEADHQKNQHLKSGDCPVHEAKQGDEGVKEKRKKKDPRDIKPRDSRKKWGMSIKRGCLARFTVKVLLHTPHLAEVCVIEAQHVNKDGVVVHGGMKVGDRGCYAARLSPTIRKFVDDCLHEGYTVHQVMKKHLKFLRKWEADGGVITRDMLITPKDVRNIARKHAKETYMLHSNDAQSVRMWVQRNPDKVFHYTETNQTSPVQVEGQLNGDNIPFTIGIQTGWQRLMMAKYGHGGGISIDATFGTNDKKVYLNHVRLLCSIPAPCYTDSIIS